MSEYKLVSDCCKSEFKVNDGSCTRYYICTQCNKMCDFVEDEKPGENAHQ